MGPIGMPELVMILIMGAFVFVLAVIPFWFICKKAGLSPWLSLITLIPLGSFVLPILLAAIDWPSLRKSESPIPPSSPLP